MMPRKRINYSYVMKQVRDINRLSSDLKNESRRLQGKINETSRGWSGQAGNEFIKQSSILQSDMNSTSRRISSLADRIQRVASSIERADERAIREYKREQAERRREAEEKRESITTIY